MIDFFLFWVSFKNRFISTHVHSNTELQKIYVKGQNWKLHINGSQYNVQTVKFYDVSTLSSSGNVSITQFASFIIKLQNG